jgi:hypothetical protein
VSATKNECDQFERVWKHALSKMPQTELTSTKYHLSQCTDCQKHFTALRPILDALGHWPSDLLQPSVSVWDRLTERIGANRSVELEGSWPEFSEPLWQSVAPGIACKFLSRDTRRNRVSMLVRLEPGHSYPAHRHAGVEELHLLEGELWIDDRKLYPGDYNRADAGSIDTRVFTETGCMCVLITSAEDVLLTDRL